MTSVIQLIGVSKVYGVGDASCRAVDGVDLAISAGEFFFLLGPSGCGKTTLLRILAGLVTPSGGRIMFGETDVTDAPVERRNTAMVFQNYALWPHMSVRANVEFGPRMRKSSAAECRRIADQCLEMVRLTDLSARRPRQLSGGQQQRVAVARALAASPACLLLDEPLSNLDAQLRLQMREQLREIVKHSGATAIYVTHDQKEALAMADRMAVMRDGRIMQVGAPHELYERPASRFVADFVGEANFGVGRVVAVDDGRVRLDTPAGTVVAAAKGGETVASEASFCVRPERLSLTAPGEAGALPVRVVSRVYQGETVQYRVALASGESWKVLAFGGGPDFAVDAAAGLVVLPEAVVLLAD